MNARNFALLACVAAMGLLACTTELESGQLGPTPESIPEPEISIVLPLERETPRRYAAPQACLLSSAKSCVELDPRPFEPCLANVKSCDEQGEGGGIIPLGDARADNGGVKSR